jgi:hydrogenase-1 operon protein HyaF
MSGSDFPGSDFAPRQNPMIFNDEEPMEGVFIGNADPVDLQLLGMPGAVTKAPRKLVTGDHKASPALRVMLDKLAAALVSYKVGERAIALPLRGLSAEDLEILGDLLGEGEVSIVAGHDPLYQVQESNMAGIWRVRATAPDGTQVLDIVEVGDVPSVVRAAVSAVPRVMPPLPNDLPDGAMNAPAVLAEIGSRALAWQPGQPNDVLNFTLMPMTEEDNLLLTRTLGQAPLTIVSGGYGTCRALMTNVRHVWAVQYLNAMGVTILDTVEVGDVPPSVTAAMEDFADSHTRLVEMVEAYF